MTTPPRASGQRLDWPQLPDAIRARIEAALGEPVVTAQTASGGFSPGMAARLTLASGRMVFAKAVSNQLNTVAPTFHRREMAVAARLPKEAPVPRLLWSWAEDVGDEWAALVFENIEGHPPAQPWETDEFDQVVDALNELTRDLTPSPVQMAEVDPAPTRNPLRGGHWERFVRESRTHLDPWVRRNLARLIEREAQVGAITPGSTLLHMDLRGDNMLVTSEGVVFVDWPHARVGPAWIDGVFLAPSVTMEGGPQPEELVSRLDALREADPDEMTTGIVEVAGFFTYNGALPPLAGLPGLREFQEAQGVVAREWIKLRTGWE